MFFLFSCSSSCGCFAAFLCPFRVRAAWFFVINVDQVLVSGRVLSGDRIRAVHPRVLRNEQLSVSALGRGHGVTGAEMSFADPVLAHVLWAKRSCFYFRLLYDQYHPVLLGCPSRGSLCLVAAWRMERSSGTERDRKPQHPSPGAGAMTVSCVVLGWRSCFCWCVLCTQWGPEHLG